MRAQQTAQSEICVFIDGDGTYMPADLPSIVKPILNEEVEMVIDSRLRGKFEKGAILPLRARKNTSQGKYNR